jgi:transposase
MRQSHTGGDKLFVDYAGQTVPIIDASTGEIRQAQVFVAVLGASNYTYACATASQKAADWVASIIASLEFIGGAPGQATRQTQGGGRRSSGRALDSGPPAPPDLLQPGRAEPLHRRLAGGLEAGLC